MALSMELRSLWCGVDKCPAAICGGPHREVATTLGIEILKADQEPLGKPLEDGKAVLDGTQDQRERQGGAVPVEGQRALEREGPHLCRGRSQDRQARMDVGERPGRRQKAAQWSGKVRVLAVMTAGAIAGGAACVALGAAVLSQSELAGMLISAAGSLAGGFGGGLAVIAYGRARGRVTARR